MLKALVQSVLRLYNDKFLTLVAWVRTNSFIKAHLRAITLWVIPDKYLIPRDFEVDSYGNALQHFGQAELFFSLFINDLFDPGKFAARQNLGHVRLFLLGYAQF
jgi:hypothetical protein